MKSVFLKTTSLSGCGLSGWSFCSRQTQISFLLDYQSYLWSCHLTPLQKKKCDGLSHASINKQSCAPIPIILSNKNPTPRPTSDDAIICHVFISLQPRVGQCSRRGVKFAHATASPKFCLGAATSKNCALP